MLALFAVGAPQRYVELIDTFQNLSPSQVLVLREQGVSVAGHADLVLSIEILVAVAYVGISLLIYWRKSSDGVALFISGVLISFIAWVDPLFDSVAAAWPEWQLPSNLIQAIGWSGAITFFCVFPNGRFVPRWTRFLPALLVVYVLPWLLLPDSQLNLANPYKFTLLMFGLANIPWTVAVGSQVYRFLRVASPIERQQAKLVFLGVTIAFGAYTVFGLDRFAVPALAEPSYAGVVYDLIGVPIFLVVSLVVPVAFAICIFRYRLWDIDVIINRTLVYGALTAILAGLYTASIALSQRLFLALTGSKSDAAIVLTTLVVASAFTPVKTALQSWVDRYFRRPSDLMAEMRAFGDQVRGFADLIDARSLTRRALDEAVRAFGATGGVVFLREGDRTRLAYSCGEWSQVEGMSEWLESGDARYGRLALGPRQNGLGYTEQDRLAFAEVVAEVGRAMGLVQGASFARPNRPMVGSLEQNIDESPYPDG